MSSEELKRYGPTSDGIIFGQQHRLIGEKTDGDFVRYEDYAALEAENGQIGRTLYERNNELCACELERSAARAQLVAIQGGMGEVERYWHKPGIGFAVLDPQYYEDETGYVAYEDYAAMAAEVERLAMENEELKRKLLDK